MTSKPTPSAAIEVFARGWVKDRQGNELPVNGSISPAECQVLHDLVIDNQVKTVIETGIARVPQLEIITTPTRVLAQSSSLLPSFPARCVVDLVAETL